MGRELSGGRAGWLVLETCGTSPHVCQFTCQFLWKMVLKKSSTPTIKVRAWSCSHSPQLTSIGTRDNSPRVDNPPDMHPSLIALALARLPLNLQVALHGREVGQGHIFHIVGFGVSHAFQGQFFHKTRIQHPWSGHSTLSVQGLQ